MSTLTLRGSFAHLEAEHFSKSRPIQVRSAYYNTNNCDFSVNILSYMIYYTGCKNAYLSGMPELIKANAEYLLNK